LIKDKDKRNSYRREYYLRNKDRIKERNKFYKQRSIPLLRRDPYSYMRMLHGKARLRRQEFNLTYEDLYDLWENQRGFCALSGQPLSLEANLPNTTSLDRINSSVGYVKTNVQLVCSVVNKMKMDVTQEVFLQFCKHITDKKLKDDLLNQPL